MSCKFKNSDCPCHCRLTDGECQFIQAGWDDKCPILAAFKDYAPVNLKQDNEKKV